MFHHLIALVCVLHVVLAAPQFVSFKDGKVGVNFGGYHAAAGLGGLLTGNAAHGGLSASAGTPWGPQAAAGLGGNLDGRAAGGAYAGAQFNDEIGASSVLGGAVGDGQKGIVGAEAHSNGNVVSKTYTAVGGGVEADAGFGGGVGVGAGVGSNTAVGAGAQYPLAPPQATIFVKSNSIQKIKPPKKYNLVKTEDVNLGVTPVHSKQVFKSVYKDVHVPATHSVVAPQYPSYDQQLPVGGAAYHAGSAGVNVNSGLIGSALNIPIGILRSLQESLAGFNINKSVSYTKLV